MTRTFCTVIDDPAAHAVLWPCGEVMARARHWSFKQIHVLGRPVKQEAQPRFGITARQLNGVRFDLDQVVNGWKGTARLEAQMLTARTDKRRGSLRFKQVGKKRRLDVLHGKLAMADRELAEGRPRVCFGGRQALRDGDVSAWQARRNSRILLIGSKDGTSGNQSMQWDGGSLRLRMPDALGGGHRRPSSWATSRVAHGGSHLSQGRSLAVLRGAHRATLLCRQVTSARHAA